VFKEAVVISIERNSAAVILVPELLSLSTVFSISEDHMAGFLNEEPADNKYLIFMSADPA
jgi:hypothetical protein